MKIVLGGYIRRIVNGKTFAPLVRTVMMSETAYRDILSWLNEQYEFRYRVEKAMNRAMIKILEKGLPDTKHLDPDTTRICDWPE